MSALTPRRRYLLQAAYEGRVWVDRMGSFWLDKRSRITSEFKPLIAAGLVRSPNEHDAQFRRIVWISDDAPIERVR